MTHAALANAAVFWLLAAMTVLLVMCLIAVILAPAQQPASPAPPEYQAIALPPPLPSRPPPAAPAPPLPRGQPPATAPTVGFQWWSPSDDQTIELDALQPLLAAQIERPQVSGTPPWGPAPKPPGVDG
jgi:hypothetical protein